MNPDGFFEVPITSIDTTRHDVQIGDLIVAQDGGVYSYVDSTYQTDGYYALLRYLFSIKGSAGANGSDANVTAENIQAALGYTPADEEDVAEQGEKVAKTNIAYATCDTEAATAAKDVTVVGNDLWELDVGSIVMVYFSVTNTASGVTLNVNGTGAYPIWYNTAEYTSTGSAYTGYAKRVLTYMFNGTHWVWIAQSYDANTTYKNVSLGHGYATCATAASTTAKVGTLASYTLTLGGIVAVKFTYAVPAGATLNINSKGAKAMFYRGAAITADVIKAGDIATFIYDGTQYQLLSVDRWQADIASLTTEEWTFTLEDGSAVTKAVYVG